MSGGQAKRIGVPLRVTLSIASVLGLGLLIVSGTLKPNVSGHGTHQQLGLPPCGILVRFGRPCPSCGMTTSWSHLARGQLGKSLKANPAGTWLGFWVLVLSVWSLVAAVVGSWKICQPNQWFFLGLAVSFLAVTFVVWVIRFFF